MCGFGAPKCHEAKAEEGGFDRCWNADSLAKALKEFSHCRLPGNFERNQWVYYCGPGLFRDRESALFGHHLKVLHRVDSKGQVLIALQHKSGQRFVARRTSLCVDQSRHCSGYFPNQRVYYTGSKVAKRHSPPTAYFGQRAVITSFATESNYAWLHLDDGCRFKTGSFGLSIPKVSGDRLSMGSEIWYVGTNLSLFCGREIMKVVLPNVADGLLVEFRDGTVLATTGSKLTARKPQQPQHAATCPSTQLNFQPPARQTVHFRQEIFLHVFSVSMTDDIETSRLALEEIFFSQDSIKRQFQDGRSLDLMKRELKGGVKDLSQIPRITVVRHEGRGFSVDNRRLWVFKHVFRGTKQILVTWGMQDHQFWSKFTTKNHGVDVRVRGER
ncbi:unnamed protein product [Symbiodinium sp. CCMP2592]|nr:unnamed protein product [Symbiodinium sp. CCMP2592]